MRLSRRVDLHLPSIAAMYTPWDLCWQGVVKSQLGPLIHGFLRLSPGSKVCKAQYARRLGSSGVQFSEHCRGTARGLKLVVCLAQDQETAVQLQKNTTQIALDRSKSLAGQLPVAEVLEALVDALAQHQCLVLQAPPGAGKTTVVPLLVDALCPGRRVLVRALKTRSSSRSSAPPWRPWVPH